MAERFDQPARFLEATILREAGHLEAARALYRDLAREGALVLGSHVGQPGVKTYPDRGGHTDGGELAIARAQAGLYLHALQVATAGLDVDLSLTGFLMLSRPGSNQPSVRAGEDLPACRSSPVSPTASPLRPR